MLQKTFFEIYINHDYADFHYRYEKQIHVLSRKLLNCFFQINRVSRSETEKNLLARLKSLYEITLSQGQLRYRVKDPSTIEIMERELKQLLQIDMQNINQNQSVINETLDSLETVYHSTLSVVAVESLAFLLFVQSVKDFYKEWMEFFLLWMKWKQGESI